MLSCKLDLIMMIVMIIMIAMITAMTRIPMMTIIANISLRTVLTMKMSCKIERDVDLSNFFRHRVILVPDVKLKNIGSVAHLVFAIRRRVVI